GGTANDGIQNGSEAGVSGVTVLLFDNSDTQVRSTTTDANGYYFFDNLAPGSYYVKIPASAFGAGQPLQGYLSSTGADSGTVTDLNDNGIDNAAPTTNGIRSNTFALAVGTMPTGEDQTGYTGTLLDNSVNATNDFGFVAANTLVAIGNRVWIDNGAGTGGVANDGIQNGAEAGVSGV
ncbi:carboxypeptidase regulatory-like domain-containing protein, partial [bacterium]|nr:carboxypeptidase regulatory-like domain-containing protein [bacterium]